MKKSEIRTQMLAPLLIILVMASATVLALLLT
jgi:hypothetical protein